jgi:hypothetical protein
MKPNYCWVKVNDTNRWEESFLNVIGPEATVLVTYVFDDNFTVDGILDSRIMYFVGVEFSTRRLVSPEESAEFELQLKTGYHDKKIVHKSYLIGKAKPIRNFVGCSDAVKIEDVIRYYEENPW